MVSLISFMHKKNFSHRDLKPENFLLDKNFNAKIIDFGFCKQTKGQLSTDLGTPQYKAPEIGLNKEYDPLAADIFSLGVIFFQLLSQSAPWRLPDPNDTENYYYFLANGYSDNFWEIHDANKQGEKYSKDLKQLLESMWNLDPTKRPKIAEIEKHLFL